MPRAVKAGAFLLASLLSSACFNASIVVTLRPDGRGTIDETMMMTAQAAQMMRGLAAMSGNDPSKAPAKPDDMFSEAEIRKRAEQLGPGVRLESVEPIHSAEGEGYKARYSFDDVTKLQLSQVPEPPVAGVTSSAPESPKMDLSFERGPSGSLLTLRMPQSKEGDATGGGSFMPEGMSPEGLMMARQMFKGARLSVVLAFDGRITRTNAPAALVDGSRITLAEIDFEQLLADPAAMDRLRELHSLSDARKLTGENKVPGLKMLTEPELVVQFSGR